MPLDPPSPTKVPVEVVIDLHITDDNVEIGSADTCLRVSEAFITYFLERKDRHRLVRFIFPDEADGYFVEFKPSDIGMKNRVTLPIDMTLEAVLVFVPKAEKKPKAPFKITIRTRQVGGGDE